MSTSQSIPLSKSKLALLCTASFVFVGIGLWFVAAPPKTDHPVFSNPMTLFIVGLASIGFFGIMGILILKKLFDKSPGLIISDEGIFDNASAVSAGFIPWADVIALSETKVASQVMINIIVKNPQEYINRQKSALKRKLMQVNHDSYGTVIGISANGLTCSHAELKGILEKAFNEFKSPHS